MLRYNFILVQPNVYGYEHPLNKFKHFSKEKSHVILLLHFLANMSKCKMHALVHEYVTLI
jgi:hypothetical protein